MPSTTLRDVPPGEKGKRAGGICPTDEIGTASGRQPGKRPVHPLHGVGRQAGLCFGNQK
ncbi:hypothetical protein [Bombella apis]|uniref:hypothetical protein n=1 Tax=Bombella apis TaxID=1785988 RepID=UPI0024A7CF52|nr:hypothetical protein [Bombella apis]